MDRDELRARAIALYDRFTHETHDRRAFMADLVKLAGSAAAANALLIGIAADPAAATIVAADDARLVTGERSFAPAPRRTIRGYRARPKAARGALPAVLVIHENRGLNDHIRDVARRVALEGFTAFAPISSRPPAAPRPTRIARGR
jgi:carboxymethylenebutenolidase